MRTQSRSDMLANEKIGPLLIRLSLPAIVGMFVHALYNTVDTIFVGQWVGPLGIAAISMVLPIVFLITAAAQTIGMGGASIISRRMGTGDTGGAGLALGNMVLLSVLLGALILLVGFAALTPLLRLFGATEDLLAMARDYFQIILLAAPFMTFSMVINNAVRAEGNARMVMVTMLSGVVLNIILDPIFIFVLDLGIRGAAIASVISMGLTSLILLIYLLTGRSEIPIRLSFLRLNMPMLVEMLTVGASSFVRVGAMSLMMVVLNHTLSRYGGDIAIAAFGVVFRLLSFIFMPISGLNMGLQPIVGFNYGARQFQRVRQSFILTITAATLVAFIGFLVILIFPEPIMKIFSRDSNLIAVGRNALRLCMIMLPLAGFQAVGAAFFQALGKPVPAILLSLSRQVLALIPLIILLPLFFGLNGIWFSLPIADLISFFITLPLVMIEFRKMPKFSHNALPVSRILPGPW